MRLEYEEAAENRDLQQAVWTEEAENVFCLGVWTEKRRGLGEDAEPTLLHNVASVHGLIGVYDGLGGAGARPAGTTADGRQVSHAFVASRLAHLAVRQWFVEGQRHGERLEDRLRAVFDGARRNSGPKLRGTLTRQLPTTLALIEYGQVQPSGTVEVTARWAGDSRCYVLTPARGLRQLSRDDSEVDDALETLVADQPMTNLVSAGGRFEVHERSHLMRYPCVLICATDGFFNYVATPALFEYHLLDCLHESGDMRHWGELLARWVRTTAGDDATIALVSLGLAKFTDLQNCFEPRWKQLRREHWEPMQRLDEAAMDDEERRTAMLAARRDSWHRYRTQYADLIPSRIPSGIAAGAMPAGNGGLA